MSTYLLIFIRNKGGFQTHLQLTETGGACVPSGSPGPGSISQGLTFGRQTRYDWDSFDPLLVAEAAFALANVLTFGRLLQTVVMVSGRLGILEISLTGMVGDIFKFLILFSMTWISFTLGMTQLYRPFHELALQECPALSIPSFIRFKQYFKSLCI